MHNSLIVDNVAVDDGGGIYTIRSLAIVNNWGFNNSLKEKRHVIIVMF